MTAAVWTHLKDKSTLLLAWCVSGVVGSLVLYGVLQERIMQHPFGSEGSAEVFKYSLFLVLCNRVVSCIAAITGILVERKTAELKPVAPIFNYALVSLSNVVATTCQYEALKHLAFPVATLGKCAKMFPVMIWGLVILRKRYTIRDVLVAFAITGGCTVFLTTGEFKSSVAVKDSSVYGALLMGGYLLFDGFTSTFQDKMFKGYNMTTYNQILYTTLWSALLSLVALVPSGQFSAAIAFLSRHPEALAFIAILSAAATTGSLFISLTIKTFGALIFAQIMTTRQFLSILTNKIIFQTSMTPGQWVGTSIIFGTLYYQAATKKSSHAKPAPEAGRSSPQGSEQRLPLLKAAENE